MIKHVKSMGVSVSNQEKALDFFTNKLGFEVRADEPMGPNARWLEVAPPGADNIESERSRKSCSSARMSTPPTKSCSNEESLLRRSQRISREE
jgi:catechol 2,3-dioxygenase-like lactoylglutathione lyase family enzyme